MKVHYPKLYNMAHLLSLNVFTASKGSNNYILLYYISGKNIAVVLGRHGELLRVPPTPLKVTRQC